MSAGLFLQSATCLPFSPSISPNYAQHTPYRHLPRSSLSPLPTPHQRSTMGEISDMSSDSSDDVESASLLTGSSSKGARGGGNVRVAPSPSGRGGRRSPKRKALMACGGCALCGIVFFCICLAFEGTTRNVALKLLGGAGVFKGRKTWMRKYIVEPHFVEFLKPQDRVLDFGAGSGMLNTIVNELGFTNLVSVDIDGVDFYGDRAQFRYYDGMHLPLKKGSIDTGIILSVLHHIPSSVCSDLFDQLSLIVDKLLVIEDCWDTIQKNGKPLGKKSFDFWDSFWNFEWTRHPHNSHSLPQWIEFFTSHGFKVVKTERHKESPWGHTFISLQSTRWVNDKDALASAAWDHEHCSSPWRGVCAPGPNQWNLKHKLEAEAEVDRNQ